MSVIPTSMDWGLIIFRLKKNINMLLQRGFSRSFSHTPKQSFPFYFLKMKCIFLRSLLKTSTVFSVLKIVTFYKNTQKFLIRYLEHNKVSLQRHSQSYKILNRRRQTRINKIWLYFEKIKKRDKNTQRKTSLGQRWSKDETVIFVSVS